MLRHVFVLAPVLVLAQNLPPAVEMGFRTGGGSNGLTQRFAVVSPSGDIFVAGVVHGTGFATAATAGPRGVDDIYLLRLTPNGDALKYAKVIGGSATDCLNAMALSPDGSVFLAGSTASTDFPGISGQRGSFFAKISPQGDLLWTRLFPQGAISSMAVMHDLSLVIAGTSSERFGPFVARLGLDGATPLWQVQLDTPNSDAVLSIALDSADNIVVAGRSFVRMMDASGRVLAPGIRLTTAEFVARVVVAPDGDVLLTGTTPAGASVWRYSADLSTRRWQRSFPGDQTQIPDAAGAPDGSLWFTMNSTLASFPTQNSMGVCSGNQPRPLLPPFFDQVSDVALVGIDRSGQVFHSGLYGGRGFNAQAGVEIDAGGKVLVFGTTTADEFPGSRVPFHLPGGHAGVFGFRLDPQRLPVGNLAPTCLAHGATYLFSPISPLSFMTVYGSNLAGASVAVNGRPAEVTWSNDTQINFVAPREIAVGFQAEVCIARRGERRCLVPGTTSSTPALFQVGRCSAALNQDGTTNSESNPAKRGEIVSLFATGTGLAPELARVSFTDVVGPPPGCWHGSCFPQTRLVETEHLYVGHAPGLTVGVTQINVRVPTSTTGGLVLRVGESSGSGCVFVR